MDSLFFWLSKLPWLLVSPDSLLLLLVLLAWLLGWRGRVRTAVRLFGTVAVLMGVIALFPVGEWLLSPLEQRFATHPALPDAIDGIIVLGGAESTFEAQAWEQVELNDSAERLTAFMALARRYPQAQLVYSGGSGSLLNQQYKGADVAEALFAEQGLDLSRVVFERQSRNTYENALFSYRKIRPGSGENWILITTGWHLPRSVGAFCKTGWSTIPYPVDHWTRPDTRLRLNFNLSNNLRVLKVATHEWIGLAAYYLAGKTTDWLPGRCAWPS